jgi:hypothetical protein
MRNGSSRVLGIILFALIGASALVLGVMNTENGIATPLKADLAATQQFSDAANGGNVNADDIAALKNKDTDGDGLSDYDSDGIPDGVEVKNGTDPNCPEGQDCGTPAPVNNPSSSSGTDQTSLNVNDILNGSSGDASSLAPDLNAGTIPTATLNDAAQIRQMLKDQGLTDDILNTIDDKTLVQMYNDSAGSANANANANANTNQ